MKKLVSLICVLSLLSTCCFLISASSEQEYSDGTATWWDAEITEEDLNNWDTVYGIYNDVNTRATGLIEAKSLGLSKTDEGTLAVSAMVMCNSDVDKCGHTYIKLQRQVGSNWNDVLSWTDQYRDGATASFGKLVSTSHGYYYRVICNHYAYRDRFLLPDEEQNVYNETTSLYY